MGFIAELIELKLAKTHISSHNTATSSYGRVMQIAEGASSLDISRDVLTIGINYSLVNKTDQVQDLMVACLVQQPCYLIAYFFSVNLKNGSCFRPPPLTTLIASKRGIECNACMRSYIMRTGRVSVGLLVNTF